MYTGAYGGATRRTYGVLGNEVNMAARFMAHAQPGQVIVNERIADAAEQSHLFQSLGKIRVKGAADPIPVFEALDKRQDQRPQLSALFTTPLVGREDVLAKMNQLLDRAKNGEGQILRLQGDRGVGKSHLAAAFSQPSMDKGWQVLLGTSLSIYQTSIIIYSQFKSIC